jgi:hypothetical protein
VQISQQGSNDLATLFITISPPPQYFIYQPSVSKHTAASVANQDKFYNETSFIGLFLLTLSIQFFCQPHTPHLLFVLGGKEFGGLLVIILQF